MKMMRTTNWLHEKVKYLTARRGGEGREAHVAIEAADAAVFHGFFALPGSESTDRRIG